jgi:peptidoglycan/xylan/chitin deacetylase (PgdA/CDA1 family)
VTISVTWFVPLFAAASALAQGAAPQAPSDSLRVPILVYHSVAPHHPGQTPDQRQLDVDTSVFAEQMSYLADHQYHVISLSRLIAALEGSDPIPDRAVVITFDDGWENQFHYAFPVLRRLGLKATFFVYTRPIGRDDSLYMNWSQLREMQDAGMTIGSHSRTHPMLTNADVALRDEVETSRADIQRNLGTTPEFFAYPYGAWNAAAADAVRAAGYRGARAYPRGPWNTSGDVYSLRSILVTDDMGAFMRALGEALMTEAPKQRP